MIIIDKRPSQPRAVPFYLSIGDTFIYNNCLYIKTSDRWAFNCNTNTSTRVDEVDYCHKVGIQIVIVKDGDER